MMDIRATVTPGKVNANTDFLYLVPLSRKKNSYRKSIEVPQKLGEAERNRVFKLTKPSNLCENEGESMVELDVPKGKYKIFFLRIEDENRIDLSS